MSCEPACQWLRWTHFAPSAAAPPCEFQWCGCLRSDEIESLVLIFSAMTVEDAFALAVTPGQKVEVACGLRMGQIFGIPDPLPDFIPFVNRMDPFLSSLILSPVPREAIDSLWLSFNLHGEGWGLDLDELRNIFAGADYIRENLGALTPPSLLTSLQKLLTTNS
jgi:hypothetical protein